jgi:hypothetical protein
MHRVAEMPRLLIAMERLFARGRRVNSIERVQSLEE